LIPVGIGRGSGREVADDVEATESVLEPSGWISGKSALIAEDRWVSGGSNDGYRRGAGVLRYVAMVDVDAERSAGSDREAVRVDVRDKAETAGLTEGRAPGRSGGVQELELGCAGVKGARAP
jgi:hypothetical protein